MRRRIHAILRDIVAFGIGLRDPQVPRSAKMAGLFAVAYLFLPIDLIPDFIPVVGWLDDLAMIPLTARIASRFIPPGLWRRLQNNADTLLLRLGPRIAAWAALFVFLWLILAGIGAYLFWHDTAPSPAPTEHLFLKPPGEQERYAALILTETPGGRKLLERSFSPRASSAG